MSQIFSTLCMMPSPTPAMAPAVQACTVVGNRALSSLYRVMRPGVLVRVLSDLETIRTLFLTAGSMGWGRADLQSASERRDDTRRRRKDPPDLGSYLKPTYSTVLQWWYCSMECDAHGQKRLELEDLGKIWPIGLLPIGQPSSHKAKGQGGYG